MYVLNPAAIAAKVTAQRGLSRRSSCIAIQVSIVTENLACNTRTGVLSFAATRLVAGAHIIAAVVTGAVGPLLGAEPVGSSSIQAPALGLLQNNLLQHTLP